MLNKCSIHACDALPDVMICKIVSNAENIMNKRLKKKTHAHLFGNGTSVAETYCKLKSAFIRYFTFFVRRFQILFKVDVDDNAKHPGMTINFRHHH